MIELKGKLGEREIIIATGKLAKQADGAVTVQCGGTFVLVTCVCSKKPREGLDFFPLTVEYKERIYAAGKIPGGFFKREGRPTEKEILTSRLIDRPIRPLFPKGMSNEVQVIATVLSSDGEINPDVLSIIGASAALTISDIPFEGPIGAVRIGLKEGQFIINPTYQQDDESDLDMVVVSNKESVLMLEAGANMISEEKALEAIQIGQETVRSIIDIQEKLKEQAGKNKREDITFFEVNKNVYAKVDELAENKIKEILKISEKQLRIEEKAVLKEKIMEQFPDEQENVEADVTYALEDIEKNILRNMILDDKQRLDGRGIDEIRPLSSEINILPETHGCGLFTRGETQALAVVTLGTSADQQRIESLRGDALRGFLLHYNFPPFSVGEARPLRGPGRREVGHGALAAKALKAILPAPESFPYTIRIVSEILESNGSSSMATVCSGSLALMAAGVPVLNPVAGIAMGVIVDGDKFTILTDIAGAEDHNGDMDFKVAGSVDGISAIQMDLKVKGVSRELLKEAFSRAKKARIEILEHMAGIIDKPLPEIAPNAPRIVSIVLPPDKIREVIGSGGKVIKKIVAETGADVNIDDDGVCQIASNNKESLDAAVEWVQGIIAEPEVGKIYDARIVNIVAFGAFCEFMPGKEGLIHVSEISDGFVKNVEDVLKLEQKVKVKVIGIDDAGRVKLSIKQAKEKEESSAEDQG
jgi:polyribonucleotide nucleotidyltransferase